MVEWEVEVIKVFDYLMEKEKEGCLRMMVNIDFYFCFIFDFYVYSEEKGKGIFCLSYDVMLVVLMINLYNEEFLL